jgi:Dyp-type peroxidase family
LAKLNFSNIQGNILKGFDKDNVRLMFFYIGSVDKASHWFRQLVEQKRIPSTTDLIDAEVRINQIRKYYSIATRRETWMHIGFSANGLRKFKLDLPPSHNAYAFKNLNPKKKAIPRIFLKNASVKVDQNDPFNVGMKNRSKILGDIEKDDPKNWIEPFNHVSDRIDGVIRVDSDDPADADKVSIDLINEFTEKGLACVGLQKGTVIFNRHGKHIEHFGFRDGVSQPLFKGIDDDKIAKRKIEKDVHDPKKFVLFGLKGRRSWANDGSFMVIRRLSQDFEVFWNFMEKNSQIYDLSPTGLAARFVGRWKSGAPLARYPKGDPDLPGAFDDNEFKYLDNNRHRGLNDPRGEKTPRFAHIRKVYPRDDGMSKDPEENDKQADTHRIIRRGIPFGPIFADNPEAERGLLFICYQVDLEQQFEFIQQSFANSPNFPRQDEHAAEGHGIDPIIGKHRDRGFVNLLQNGRFRKITGLKQWITTTGGEYFFSPSLSALKNLKTRQKRVT